MVVVITQHESCSIGASEMSNPTTHSNHASSRGIALSEMPPVFSLVSVYLLCVYVCFISSLEKKHASWHSALTRLDLHVCSTKVLRPNAVLPIRITAVLYLLYRWVELDPGTRLVRLLSSTKKIWAGKFS